MKNKFDNKEKTSRKTVSLPTPELLEVLKIRNRVLILEENFIPSESEIFRAGLIALNKNSNDEIRKIVKSLK